MEIYKSAAKLKTDELKVNKSVASLIISSSNAVETYANETISLWIERVQGNNVYIAQNIKLLDYVALSNYGNESIQSEAGLGSVALCELSDAAVFLREGESLKVSMAGLIAANTYQVNTVEDPITTNDLYMFDRKTIASEDVQKTVDVSGVELGILNLDASIQEVTFVYENGARVKYSPWELNVLTRGVDPIFAITKAGTVLQGLPTRTILPLVGVVALEFLKTAGVLIEMTTRRTDNLLNIE